MKRPSVQYRYPYQAPPLSNASATIGRIRERTERFFLAGASAGDGWAGSDGAGASTAGPVLPVSGTDFTGNCRTSETGGVVAKVSTVCADMWTTRISELNRSVRN